MLICLFFIIVSAKLEETKLKQKLREKPKGVNVIGLANGQKVTNEDVITKVSRRIFPMPLLVRQVFKLFLYLSAQNDPFKVKSGGMVNMKNLKSGKVNQIEDPYDVGIGTQFSAETNKRDEDEEMMK